MVFNFGHTRLARASGAAVEGVIGLDTVPYDLAAAMVTHGRELMNGALETVERVARACRNDLEGQVIIVAAHFTLCHLTSPSCSRLTATDSDLHFRSSSTAPPYPSCQWADSTPDKAAQLMKTEN